MRDILGAPRYEVAEALDIPTGTAKSLIHRGLADLRAVGVDIITIGQYLRPTPRHRTIDRYVHPDEFARYREEGERLGLPHVEAGPLVRSSYHAAEQVRALSIVHRKLYG